MKIDWSKPLGFKDQPEVKITVLDDSFYLTKDSARHVVLKLVDEAGESWIVRRFHADGRSVSEVSLYRGHTLINLPVVTSGFYPIEVLRQPFRGMTSLSFALEEYDGSNQFIEVIREDGKPVDVKLHNR